MATSTLTDTIKDPGGNVVATSSGTVVNFRLMANGSPTPGFRISDGVNVASLIVTSATTSGTISQALENNSNITPGGTYYVAEILCPTSQGGTQEWALLSSSSASPQTFLQAIAAAIPSFTPITTVPTSVLSGNNTFTGINQFGGNVYFKSGSPWIDVKAYGAAGDGITDDGPAINTAVSALAAGGTLFFPPGTYAISTQIALTAQMQWLGAGWKGVTLKWTGGASSMITTNTNARVQFVNLNFQNSGTGTNAITGTPGQRPSLDFCSFTGGSAWSDAAVYWNGLDYGEVNRCEFEVAPAIRLGGAVTTNLSFKHCVFDAVAAASAGVSPMLKVDTNANVINFYDCTFNAETICTTFWDNSASSNTIANLNVDSCQFDDNTGGGAFGAVMNVANVRTLRIIGTNIHEYSGQTDSFITATNSRVVLDGITGNSLNKEIGRSLNNANTWFFVGQSQLTPANTKGMLNSASNTGMRISAPVISSSATIHLELLSAATPGLVETAPTSTGAFSVRIALPADSTAGYPTSGQRFTYALRNNSTGDMGAITFSSQFSLRSAFTGPGTGTRAAIDFSMNGATAEELWRSS